MLKKIPVDQLELGMFVEKFEGNWFDHPFWRTAFLVDSIEKLKTIKSSRVRVVVIDTTKGADVCPRLIAEPRENSRGSLDRPASRIRDIRRRAVSHFDSSQPVTLEQEVKTAAKIVDGARERLDKVFINARLGRALDARKVEPVVTEILASVRRNPQAFSGLMRCKLKNEQIFRHALSVSALMVALADRMKLTGPEIHNSGLAGMLLDIGVNYLPHGADPWVGGRRERDQQIWETHVRLGYRALQNDDDLPPAVLDACLHHHERLDGSGYPQGLTGDRISRVARMAAICDSFDFLLTGVLGKPKLDPAMAVTKLTAQAGAFDEEILRLFIEMVGLYPVGSFVELTSGKIAMVIDEDRKDPRRPVVQAFYSLETQKRILPHRIELANPSQIDQIIGVANLAGLELPETAQLRELIFLSACKFEDAA